MNIIQAEDYVPKKRGRKIAFCIIHVSTRCWEGRKALSKEAMEKVGDANWLKGNKHLVDSEILSPVRASIGNMRIKLAAITLPFPIPALYLAPKSLLDRIEGLLKACETEYWERVEAFLTKYAPAREEAREKLGEYFDEADYPWNIRSKFGFTWQYLEMSGPSEANVLDYEMYEREKVRFEGLMNEAKELALTSLREEFAGIVNHATERLTGVQSQGKPKVFRESLITKFEDFFATFDDRNALFYDETLKTMVEQAKDALIGVDVDDLRNDSILRKTVRDSLAAVQTEMDKALTEAPRRKIRVAS
jgi:hypothetical protein